MTFPLSKEDIKRRILQTAFGSERRYRHASFVLDDFVEDEFAREIHTIVPPYAPFLKTLKLKSNEYSMVALLPRLARVLPQMQHLEHFSLQSVSAGFPEAVLLESNTVRQLEVILSYDIIAHHRHFIRLHMPNLTSYSGKLHILDGSTTLDQLTDVTLTKPCSLRCYVNLGYYQERLSRLTNLTKLEIGFEVDDKLFEAICKCCPSLQVLVLANLLDLNDINKFALLNRLENLRRLELESFFAANTGYIDLTPMAQLNYLVLRGTYLDECSKVTFPKSLKKVTMHIFGWLFMNRTRRMYQMCAEMEQLTELDVVFQFNNAAQTLPELLDAIRCMGKLKRLSVSNGLISECCFEMLKTVLPGLRSILFVGCRIAKITYLGIGAELRIKNCIDSLANPIQNGCFPV
uniref:Uncharacterized protein n=1 Tax=Anopheles albimanus TaxID=7167 RepID=A0A182FIC3_ANOAL